jgi:hypothetical protein
MSLVADLLRPRLFSSKLSKLKATEKYSTAIDYRGLRSKLSDQSDGKIQLQRKKIWPSTKFGFLKAFELMKKETNERDQEKGRGAMV